MSHVSPTPPPQQQSASALANSLFQSDDGLIAYLQHNTDYSQDAAGNYTHNNPVPARSPSPPLPLPIPPSLNRLASNALSGFHSPNLQPLPAPVDQAQVAAQMDYGDRGEMGGKRRKLPHQRAGWAEMEQQSGKKRRISRKSTEGSPGPHSGGGGSPSGHTPGSGGLHVDSPSHGAAAQDITSLTELSQMAINGQAAAGVDVGHVHGQEEPQIDPTLASAQEKEPVGPPPPPPEPPVDTGKLSRAEQNKRAQQAFRRRREEHMKKLEAESAQLQVVLRQCQEKDAVIKDLVMSQQTDKIRIAALETFIRQNATTHGTTPPFTGTGELNISEDLSFPHQSETGVSQDQLENAFQMLERQSRQVVKQLNRGQGL
ncbi:hypothetical protein L202_03846 [Cryptococcus amylolentus CBS 6039]|uniref:BZIP domain-containing protein n=2 Tax=Cryptococcus amylolentus TaxID=104669 RepID=A0A1E3HV05_9TREE|nr:hypothetical protein L202_03846 [Cryptococcus amylolentus CBS 6039]ODN79975.1 hypothetical protein L202_03846 [Cryptococcus amylolentus CBS 6039]ODO08215.1 hypothetical protein I350_03804 [Cryptococcus amylolentus CBS 6273]